MYRNNDLLAVNMNNGSTTQIEIKLQKQHKRDKKTMNLSMISSLYHDQEGDLLTVDPVHE
jgi:hypothetical protein